MTYRSERFPEGDLAGLGTVWGIIDNLEAAGLPVVAEVMSGTSYRRQLTPQTAERIGNLNYVLQVVFSLAEGEGQGRPMTAQDFVDTARTILGEIDAPGVTTIDEGGLVSSELSSGRFPFRSTGRTEDDVDVVYPPWVGSEWTEEGKSFAFFCGIEPPRSQGSMVDCPITWDERVMRFGAVVFEPTPTDLEAY